MGLDFGCGPSPVLAEMFAEAGFAMKVFDLYYANNPDVIDVEKHGESYDFITTTEVVEHLVDPRTVLNNLLALLRHGGMLGIMTKQVGDRDSFKNWHYIRDRTHISFFSRETFEWLAARTGCRVEFVGADVVLLRKPLRFCSVLDLCGIKFWYQLDDNGSTIFKGIDWQIVVGVSIHLLRQLSLLLVARQYRTNRRTPPVQQHPAPEESLTSLE